MNKKIDDKSFDVLLYVSRIEASKEEKALLQTQISNIVSYFEELEKFSTETLSFFDACNSEDDLRVSDDKCYIEGHLLKNMSDEFMDGYFRSPKVLMSS